VIKTGKKTGKRDGKRLLLQADVCQIAEVEDVCVFAMGGGADGPTEALLEVDVLP
jgi:hypothetical protein